MWIPAHRILATIRPSMDFEQSPDRATELQQTLDTIEGELARLRGSDGNRLHQPDPDPGSGERPTTEERIAELEQQRADIQAQLKDQAN